VRILVLSNLYPPAVRGGYEVECAGIVAFLRERGDTVRVLTSREGASASDLGSEVVRALPLLKHPRVARLLAPAAAALAARITRREIAQFDPDAVFVWNAAQLPHAAVDVILSTGIPTIFRVCEQWFGGLFSDDRFMRRLSHTARPGVDPLAALARVINTLPPLRLDGKSAVPVAISWASEYLRATVSVPERLDVVLERTIYPATDRDSEFASVERRESSSPLIVFLGRLSSEKGCDVLIQACGLLADRGVSARLVVAGGGSRSDLSRLRQVAETVGVADRCAFPGRLAIPEIRKLFAAGTVLAIPSTWNEPFGLVVIEGALARIPVVASRVGGIPEILEDGKEILLVPPADPEALADAIAHTIDRPQDARERARRAYTRARSLSWSSYASSTGAFVDDALRALTRE